MSEQFIVVDVGCIECAQQTQVIGIYPTEDEARSAFLAQCDKHGIKHWEPRGGMLEFIGELHYEFSTYLGGTGYFERGQRALELHVLPPRKLEKLKDETEDGQQGKTLPQARET